MLSLFYRKCLIKIVLADKNILIGFLKGLWKVGILTEFLYLFCSECHCLFKKSIQLQSLKLKRGVIKKGCLADVGDGDITPACHI